MKKKTPWGLVCILTTLILVFTACAPKTTPTPLTPTPTAAPPTPTVAANWWDKFGEPEYGGMLTTRTGGLDTISLDPLNLMMGQYQWWYETLFYYDWTLDRNTWSYMTQFIPAEYHQGLLAESWEQTDPQTWTVHLRQGVHWQNKPPVNGREFTAEDVQFNYDRMLGTGSGFTEPNMFAAGWVPSIERVVATDTYTVEFKLKKPGIMAVYQILNMFNLFSMAAPEWVQQGDLGNWESAVGTGPWLLTDFVPGTSLTYGRNPDYWGYDERHPENRLPYMDTVKVVAIPDIATALAALRTGQTDGMLEAGTLSWQDAARLAESNPEIVQAMLPGQGSCLSFRCDKAPFTNIRVRKALQMSINREVIAQTHYGGTVDGTPCGLVSPLYEDYAFTYDQWPAELKEEYGYNPDEARRLLAEATQDGVFEPNQYGGFDTNCIATPMGDNVELLEIIKSYFMDIGVDMEIRVMDMAGAMAFVMAGEHDQMYMERWVGVLHSPVSGFSLPVRGSGSHMNVTYNNDARYDALLSQIDSSTDMAEVKRLCQEADRYAIEQHWAVNVCPTANAIFWQPWVKGYSGEAVDYSSTAGATQARLWIDQDLKK